MWRWMVLVASVAASPVSGDLVLNEIFFNPSLTDDKMEFIEIRSTTGGIESLSGLTLVVIEGDSTGSGLIDRFYTFGASDATGTSGLLLLRDSPDPLSPAADPATTVIVVPTGPPATFFDPDLENGTQTYLLVSGFSGTVGTDLDTDSDGAFDGAPPWTGVIDAVAYTDDGAGDLTYSPLPSSTLAVNSMLGLVADSVLFRDGTTDEWIQAHITSASLPPAPPPYGPFITVASESFKADGSPVSGSVVLSAGTPNGSTTTAVPEPSALLLFGLGGLLCAARRRRAA